jgi:hypothetical protein
MRISSMFAPLAVTTLMLVGCGNKQPATQIVAQAESILSDLRNEGTSFAPDELKVADSTLASMKSELDADDYKGVVKLVPTFNEQVKTLKETVVTRQSVAAAASNEWQTLNAEVPKTVEALQIRLDGLKGSKLPKEISKETYEAAKMDFETMKTTWAEATADAAAGKTAEAAEKGRQVAAKGDELKGKLGVSQQLAAAAPSVAPPMGSDISPAN